MRLTQFGDIIIETALITCGEGHPQPVQTFFHILSFLQHALGNFSMIPNLVNAACRNKDRQHFTDRTTCSDPWQCSFGCAYGFTAACSCTYSCIYASGYFCCFKRSNAFTAFASNTKLVRAVKKGAGCKELQKDLRDWVIRQPNDGLNLIWINVN